MTFTQVYCKHYQNVLRTCRAILKDSHAAEDATQETFYKLMEKWDELTDRDALGAWLNTTATNKCIDIIRKRQREIPLERLPIEECSGEDIGKQLMIEAEEIAENFAPIYKEVFRLYFKLGYSGKDISKMLSIPLSTVKTRIRVCTQKIRAAL